MAPSGEQFIREPMPPVSLREICRLVGVQLLPGSVTGVTLDSRAVAPGDLYAALPGAKTHGAIRRRCGQRRGGGDPDRSCGCRCWALEVPTVVCPDPARGPRQSVLWSIGIQPEDCAPSQSPVPTARPPSPTCSLRPSPHCRCLRA